MRLRHLTPLCALLLLTTIPLHAESPHAENLDEAGIGALYEDMGNAVQDFTVTQKLMEKRLDDNYKEKRTTTQHIRRYPDKTEYNTFDKIDAIGTRMNEFNAMQLTTYQQTILGIKYAADKKTADVVHVSAAHGLITIPTDDQGTTTLVKYDDDTKCNDKVGLVDATVKVLQSDCEEHLTLYE